MHAKTSPQLPTYVPYLELLPPHVRKEMFSLYNGALDRNSRGQVDIKHFFEMLLDQYIDADYGKPGEYGLPSRTSKRCVVLGHVIRICKLTFVPCGIWVFH